MLTAHPSLYPGNMDVPAQRSNSMITAYKVHIKLPVKIQSTDMTVQLGLCN